jgi:hypothetical protein
MTSEISIHESKNLTLPLLFPAAGFAFIAYILIEEATGRRSLAFFVVAVVFLLFIALWRSVAQSIVRAGDDVIFVRNGGVKKLHPFDTRKISVIAGPLSRSVLIIAWPKRGLIPIFSWSAFNQSSAGDYMATICAIRKLLDLNVQSHSPH